MSLTRRSFVISGAVSLAVGHAGARAVAAPHARATGSGDDVDVVVVGAGAAGLAAAKELMRLNKRIIVLEARDRIGGRAFTDESLGIPFDAGAQYIHWAERNPWLPIAREHGVELTEDLPSPVVSFATFHNGRRAEEGAQPSPRGRYSRLSALMTGRDAGADVSFADLVAQSPDLLEPAGNLTRLALGEDPERVSVADYNQLWAADDFLLPGGYGALVERYGANVPVRRSAVVRRIRWDARGVVVETRQGTIRAGAVIVTVPVGVLAAEAIRFVPALPLATREAIAGLHMGALTKIALRFDGARFGYPDNFDLYEIGDPNNPINIELWPLGRDLAILSMGGDGARNFLRDGESEAVRRALDVIANIIGSDCRRHFQAGRAAGWWSDPFARGSYSVAWPGHAGARAALRQPVGKRLFFAGEATANGGAMTVGGATLEGRRAAAEAAR